MSATERRKGADGERDFFQRLSLLTGVELKRNLHQAREGGSDSPDHELFAGIYLEIRNRSTVFPDLWFNEVRKKADEQWPVLAWKVPRKGWKVRTIVNIDGEEYQVDIRLEEFANFLTKGFICTR
jgi:hypothetical protein